MSSVGVLLYCHCTWFQCFSSSLHITDFTGCFGVAVADSGHSLSLSHTHTHVYTHAFVPCPAAGHPLAYSCSIGNTHLLPFAIFSHKHVHTKAHTCTSSGWELCLLSCTCTHLHETRSSAFWSRYKRPLVFTPYCHCFLKMAEGEDVNSWCSVTRGEFILGPLLLFGTQGRYSWGKIDGRQRELESALFKPATLRVPVLFLSVLKHAVSVEQQMQMITKQLKS